MVAQSGGPDAPQHPPPQYSADRKWWWDGARWIPAPGDAVAQEGESTEPPEGPGPPIKPEPDPRLSPGQRDARSATDDEKLWSLLSHVSLFVLLIIGPLIIMWTAGKRSSYVRHHAAEALNFQITVAVAAAVGSTLFSIVGLFQFEQLPLIVAMISALMVAVIVAYFVFPIRAAVRSYQGQLYRYPMTLRFVKPGRRHIKPEDGREETDQGYAAWMRKVEDDLVPSIESPPQRKETDQQPGRD